MKIIVACDENNGIGKDNKIPWVIKEDLNNFKKITSHTNTIMNRNVVIMGRNTWESIPKNRRPLVDRINIVLTTKDNYLETSKDLYTCKSLSGALKHIESLPYCNKDNIFIIGGERIYKEAIDSELCEKLYITKIYSKFDCDKFFPSISDNYKLTNVSKFKISNTIYYRDLVYINSKKCFKLNIHKLLWTNTEEMQYLNCLNNILTLGTQQNDRTGVGTLSCFGEMFKYDLSDTLPLLTTKRMFFRGIFEELKLYLSGKTDNSILQEKNIHIWDGNTSRDFLDKRGLHHYPENDMGETYGHNFRHYGATYNTCKEDYSGKGFDQVNYVIDLIKNVPTSRRIIIDLWNCSTLHKAALPSCLCKYQFNVNVTEKLLNLVIYIRSSDFFLANNWNTITGALFVHMICNLNGIDLTPGTLTVFTADTHIYNSHINQVKVNLSRTPKPFPKLLVKSKKNNIEDFEFSDFELLGYNPDKNLPVPMAV